LADLIGASRQKVNLNLQKLVNQGLIRAERGRITILDQNGLQELG
ncbi:MAG: winged helix-turn-helix domain-containing protein, partial [Methanomassiliicoccales archaeon]|nr:winged helix-turn-helix domain-containing protein [Methanomassiliicoccales archaeon]